MEAPFEGGQGPEGAVAPCVGEITVHIFFYRYTTLFSHSSRQNCSAHLSVGSAFPSPVDISPCRVLSTIVSQLFPSRHHLSVCGRQDFASALETDDYRSAMDSCAIGLVVVWVLADSRTKCL
jgi:hypothetical protein